MAKQKKYNSKEKEPFESHADADEVSQHFYYFGPILFDLCQSCKSFQLFLRAYLNILINL